MDKAYKDHKEPLVLEFQEKKDYQDSQVHLATKDYKDHQGCLGKLDYLDLANLDTLAQRVTKGWEGFLVLRDQKETKVTLVNQA